MRVRHPNNRNLRLMYGPEWQGLRVIQYPNGLIANYLEDVSELLDDTVTDYARSIVLRFDLCIPNFLSHVDSAVISRFISAMKSRLSADAEKRRRSGVRIYPCEPRFVWVKEQCHSSAPHYHVAMTLNNDAYFTLGAIRPRWEVELMANGDYGVEQRRNMVDRIREAWASALGVSSAEAVGLVHIPENPVYKIDRNSPEVFEQYACVFYRLSYFAKADTKPYGDGSRHFGCSRRRLGGSFLWDCPPDEG